MFQQAQRKLARLDNSTKVIILLVGVLFMLLSVLTIKSVTSEQTEEGAILIEEPAPKEVPFVDPRPLVEGGGLTVQQKKDMRDLMVKIQKGEIQLDQLTQEDQKMILLLKSVADQQVLNNPPEDLSRPGNGPNRKPKISKDEKKQLEQLMNDIQDGHVDPYNLNDEQKLMMGQIMTMMDKFKLVAVEK